MHAGPVYRVSILPRAGRLALLCTAREFVLNIMEGSERGLREQKTGRCARDKRVRIKHKRGFAASCLSSHDAIRPFKSPPNSEQVLKPGFKARKRFLKHS